METNYLILNGTSICNENQRKILYGASFNNFKVLRYERLTNGKYDITKYNPQHCFVYNNNLYYFLTHLHGGISSFFPLNTNSEQCAKGKYGVYFEIHTAIN